jgi:hypothetical protein
MTRLSEVAAVVGFALGLLLGYQWSLADQRSRFAKDCGQRGGYAVEQVAGHPVCLEGRKAMP